jgi:hypothetical protein
MPPKSNKQVTNTENNKNIIEPLKLRFCNICNFEKTKNEFSKTQWSKKKDLSVSCLECSSTPGPVFDVLKDSNFKILSTTGPEAAPNTGVEIINTDKYGRCLRAARDFKKGLRDFLRKPFHSF